MYPNTHIPSCRKKTYLKIWWQSPNSCQSLKVESTLKQLQLIYPLPKTLPAVSQVIITAVLTRHIGRLTEIACRKAGKEQSVLPFRSAPLPAARPRSAGRPRLPLCLPVPGPACWPQFHAGTAEQDRILGSPKAWGGALLWLFLAMWPPLSTSEKRCWPSFTSSVHWGDGYVRFFCWFFIWLPWALVAAREVVVVVHGLGCPMHVGSSFPDQGSNPHPCIGRQILNHWTTREVPVWVMRSFPLSELKNSQVVLFHFVKFE